MKVPVRKLHVGDLTTCSTFNKIRPMLILKVTEDFVYGVPLSSQKDEFAFTNKGIDDCRFLKAEVKSYIHPMVQRVGYQWAAENWIGLINPASVIKIKKQLKDILNEIL